MEDDFNKVAEDRAAWRKSVLAAVDQARRNHGFAEAMANQDWPRAIDLHKAGADPRHSDSKALKALSAIDSVAAMQALAQIDVPGVSRLGDTPFLVAAKKGNLATLKYGVDSELPPETLSSALYLALDNKQEDAGDLLLEYLPYKDMTEAGLFALLRYRPALYEEALTARDNKADFFAHFYSACNVKDEAAMAVSLEKLDTYRHKLPPYLFSPGEYFNDFMGPPPMMELMVQVMETGKLDIIDRFIDAFPDSLPPPYLVMIWATNLSQHLPDLLPHLAEKLQPEPVHLAGAMRNAGSGGDVAAAKFFIENYTAEARKNALPLLRALMAEPDAVAFINAVEEKLLPLPVEKEAAQLYAAAITRDNNNALQYLLDKIPLTPEITKELQDSHDYAVQRHAVVEFGGDWHAKDDAVFWKGLEKNDAETTVLFPRDKKLSTASAWLVESTVKAVLARGDFAQLDDIIANADWTKDARERVFKTLLQSQAALDIAAKHSFLPEALRTADMYDIAAHDGGGTLQWLADHGVELTDKVAEEGLKIAVQRNAPGMIGYMFANDIGRPKDPRDIALALTSLAGEPALQAMEKWVTREELKPANGIAAEISAATAFFDGAESLAVRAAYANQFAPLMQKAAAQAGFDPAVLVSTKDAHGNSVLEILGAHGKLNDILDPASLWRDRDAVAFIKDNTPAMYHEQVDFSALKAQLDLLRLSERSRNDRFRLK
ncbi:MAG: hypothetical protein K0R10_2633 [Alphaproteobacteria bacterium]|jgi:hypothetical protein|nr:hypothetical protein [Alphaproteobacteria bacterium]